MKPIDIIEAVCEYMELSYEQIKETNRSKRVVTCRQMCMHFVYGRLPHVTFHDIGKMFERDHSTVIHAVGVVRDRMFLEPDFRKMVREIEKILDHPKEDPNAIVYDINHVFKSA